MILRYRVNRHCSDNKLKQTLKLNKTLYSRIHTTVHRVKTILLCIIAGSFHLLMRYINLYVGELNESPVVASCALIVLQVTSAASEVREGLKENEDYYEYYPHNNYTDRTVQLYFFCIKRTGTRKTFIVHSIRIGYEQTLQIVASYTITIGILCFCFVIEYNQGSTAHEKMHSFMWRKNLHHSTPLNVIRSTGTGPFMSYFGLH